MAGGLLFAAPASGSGKTVCMLALLRHFRNAGVAAASVKAGPDYIDSAFHSRASGRPCTNLDTWAMRPGTLAALADTAGRGAELILGEGVMGLFDGAPDGRGSTADLARVTGWPVILVVDAGGMAATAAAVVRGLASHQPEIEIGGVIFNRVGGARHEGLLRDAMAPLGIPVLGALPRAPALALPERHLGLVQAAEHGDLEGFLDEAARLVATHVDLESLRGRARPARLPAPTDEPPLPPFGRHIAVARDAAFAFCYPFVVDAWRRCGAEISFFSPLANEAPPAQADAVYLPGGYPELHAARLESNRRFKDGLRRAAARGAFIYGECGGFMVLGRRLIDPQGHPREMAGLLPLQTSFAKPRLSLGYRQLSTARATPLGPTGTTLRGHEFHYSTMDNPTSNESGDAEPLFHLRDAAGRGLGAAGMVRANVAGSYVHLVDRSAASESRD